MRGLALIVAALAVSAPAAGAMGSGLYGTVMRVPAQPVCIVDEPCGRPAAGVRLEFQRKGVIVARAVTGKDGSYRVALRAGIYSVRSGAPPAIGRQLKPRTARVATGKWSRVNFSLDVGIR